MVHVVDATNRPRFYAELDHMHRDREFVFGGHGAQSSPGSRRDIDRFDTTDAIYLLEADRRSRRHLASVRLVPSTRPHMLTTVLAHLCECGVPVANDIWEVSRFCVSPDVTPSEDQRMRSRLLLAIAEFAILRGIRHYTCATPVRCLPGVMAAGWNAKPLGLPLDISAASMGAVLFTLTSATLDQARGQLGCRASVLEFDDEHAVA
jgi:N-acyl-L-homoserine lactone synthetase